MNNNAFKVAFCGLTSALALVLMLCTGLIPVGTYAFPMIAGILFTVIVIEFGAKWAYCAFIVVALLSLFLAGDKEAVIYFIAFFGFYPILKSSIERIKSKVVQYVLKYAVFNVCMIVAFLVAKFILMIPDEEFTLMGFYVPWAFLIIGDLFFILYDKCVTIIIIRYVQQIRVKFVKK
jgi:hypothetical protein